MQMPGIQKKFSPDRPWELRGVRVPMYEKAGEHETPGGFIK